MPPTRSLRAGGCLLLWALFSGARLAAGDTIFQLVDGEVSASPGGVSGTAQTASALGIGGMDIVLQAGAGLSGNAAALAAFERAAHEWEAIFSDPITITIEADFQALGSPSIIGQTSTVFLRGTYTEIRDQLVADSDLTGRDAINAFLPTAAQFTALLPAGYTLSGDLVATKANLKAMGFIGLDEEFGVLDASITFNSGFNFDYDRSDGIGADLLDFQTAAVHEIGHALGFFSTVEAIDSAIHQGITGAVDPTPLDLFRFRDGDVTSDPESALDFTTKSRDLTPGEVDITDFVMTTGAGEAAENAMSTGSTQGDGRQASHWKADEKSGQYIGIMDPTLDVGTVEEITPADVRALDAIGYDVVPEPGSAALLSLGLGGILLRRRRAAH